MAAGRLRHNKEACSGQRAKDDYVTLTHLLDAFSQVRTVKECLVLQAAPDMLKQIPV